jgi:hypothetical protein
MGFGKGCFFRTGSRTNDLHPKSFSPLTRDQSDTTSGGVKQNGFAFFDPVCLAQ